MITSRSGLYLRHHQTRPHINTTSPSNDPTHWDTPHQSGRAKIHFWIKSAPTKLTIHYSHFRRNTQQNPNKLFKFKAVEQWDGQRSEIEESNKLTIRNEFSVFRWNISVKQKEKILSKQLLEEFSLQLNLKSFVEKFPEILQHWHHGFEKKLNTPLCVLVVGIVIQQPKGEIAVSGLPSSQLSLSSVCSSIL